MSWNRQIGRRCRLGWRRLASLLAAAAIIAGGCEAAAASTSASHKTAAAAAASVDDGRAGQVPPAEPPAAAADNGSGGVRSEAVRSGGGGYRSPGGSFSGGGAARTGPTTGGTYRTGPRTPSPNVPRSPRTTTPGGFFSPGRAGSFLGGLAAGAILGHLLNPFAGFGWGAGGYGGGIWLSILSLLIWAVLLYAAYRIIRRLFSGPRNRGGRYR